MTNTSLRSRGFGHPEEKVGPSRSGTLSVARPQTPPAGREDLRALVEGYRGFGMLSIVRVLLVRGRLHFPLAVLSVFLLVGQWVGPSGFIAFKLEAMDMDDACPGGGSRWARWLMASVALIYTARLSVAALTHTLERPQEFDSYNMPKWWETYRLVDVVLASLLYDTVIFMFNLFIVFQDGAVESMILNVLALEFFTMIDDEFKVALLKYDCSFLDEMLIANAVPGLEEGAFSISDGEKDTRNATCAEAVEKIVPQFLVAALLGVRLICRVIGPLFAAGMIVVGPYCMGSVAG